VSNLKSGDIISYPYLWSWQKRRGETEGRKDRPSCVAIAAMTPENLTELIILPISSQQPSPGQVAVEIPPLECRRVKIKPPAWITVSEFNYDIAEHSHSYNPVLEALGSFSPGFLRILITGFLEQRPRKISRSSDI
jgi:hypothetical protein